jgi:hypothetical protein
MSRPLSAGDPVRVTSGGTGAYLRGATYLGGVPRAPAIKDIMTPAVYVGLAFYALLYCSFFPKMYVVSDETGYLTAAHYIYSGKVFDRHSEAYFISQPAGGVEQFRGRSILFSAILACLLPLHWKAAFLVGLACHLATFILIALTCVNAGRSPWWSWLVLLHPSLSLYSRTIMTDVPSGTAVAAVLFLLLVKPRYPRIAGTIAGASLFLRITNCWIGLAACLQLLHDDLGRRDIRGTWARVWYGESRRFALPYMFFCSLLLVGNLILYGGPLTTSYSGTDSKGFALTNLVQNVPFYLVALNLIWPGMLVGAWFLPRRVRVFGVTLVAVQLLFFSNYYFRARGTNFIESSVMGLRLLLGSVIVLCAGYPVMVERLVRQRAVPKCFVAMALLIGVAGTAVLFGKHSAHLEHQAPLPYAVYAATATAGAVYVCPNAEELFCPVFGQRNVRLAKYSYLHHLYQDVRPGDFFVFYIQPPPRNPGQVEMARASERLLAGLRTVAELRQIPMAKDCAALQIFEVIRMRPGAKLSPIPEEERSVIFP